MNNIKIQFPGISQSDFEYALECLELCKQESAPEYGFRYPYFAPGGDYGKQWWQLDASIALCGYKWFDQEFAEKAILNFIESQKEDGRICLWGYDTLPGGTYKQINGVSSLPKIFDSAYHILKRTDNKELKTKTYNMFKKYLNWWFEKRQNKATGLITAMFEETFIPYLEYAGEYAPTDTNVEVCVGCRYTSYLARELGNIEDAIFFEKKEAEISASINKYLWNEEKGAYFPFSVKENKQIDCLMASTFCPLRLSIATRDRKEKLIKFLCDHKYFNWDTRPITSVSKTDPLFTVVEGAYIGNPCWSGSVWTLCNEMAIRGLKDSGENRIAGELALKTLRIFNHNLTEFVDPLDGKGQGVKEYAWTAAQYVEIIIEVIFGISFDGKNKTVSISPTLSGELAEKSMSLCGVQIPWGGSINVMIDKGKVSYEILDADASVKI